MRPLRSPQLKIFCLLLYFAKTKKFPTLLIQLQHKLKLLAVMWIHMGYNADPGSGSASIRIPKKLSEIKKEFQTKNRVPVTYKYKICFLVFIVCIQYLHNFWFNLTHFEFKYTVCFYFLSSSFTHFLGVYFWRFFTFWIRIQDVSQNADPDAPHHCYTLHTHLHSIL